MGIYREYCGVHEEKHSADETESFQNINSDRIRYFYRIRSGAIYERHILSALRFGGFRFLSRRCFRGLFFCKDSFQPLDNFRRALKETDDLRHGISRLLGRLIDVQKLNRTACIHNEERNGRNGQAGAAAAPKLLAAAFGAFCAVAFLLR